MVHAIFYAGHIRTKDRNNQTDTVDADSYERSVANRKRERGRRGQRENAITAVV